MRFKRFKHRLAALWKRPVFEPVASARNIRSELSPTFLFFLVVDIVTKYILTLSVDLSEFEIAKCKLTLRGSLWRRHLALQLAKLCFATRFMNQPITLHNLHSFFILICYFIQFNSNLLNIYKISCVNTWSPEELNKVEKRDTKSAGFSRFARVAPVQSYVSYLFYFLRFFFSSLIITTLRIHHSISFPFFFTILARRHKYTRLSFAPSLAHFSFSSVRTPSSI